MDRVIGRAWEMIDQLLPISEKLGKQRTSLRVERAALFSEIPRCEEMVTQLRQRVAKLVIELQVTLPLPAPPLPSCAHTAPPLNSPPLPAIPFPSVSLPCPPCPSPVLPAPPLPSLPLLPIHLPTCLYAACVWLASFPPHLRPLVFPACDPSVPLPSSSPLLRHSIFQVMRQRDMRTTFQLAQEKRRHSVETITGRHARGLVAALECRWLGESDVCLRRARGGKGTGCVGV